jgi:hypothetical protein
MNNQWPRRANTSQGDIIMLAEEVQVKYRIHVLYTE